MVMKRMGWITDQGQIRGRDKEGQKRLETRAKELQTQGKSAAEAKACAREEMRDHGRKDYRGG